MESTGVYWKPVWNILSEQFEVLLVNAQHIKAVPGREDGPERQRVDRGLAAARIAPREFRAPATNM
jgi:transposase